MRSAISTLRFRCRSDWRLRHWRSSRFSALDGRWVWRPRILRSQLRRPLPVANVLEPPRESHGIATMVEGSRVTIEGGVYRESEHKAYGDRLYVGVERAAEQGGAMLASSGNVRIAVLVGGAFKLGDEIRLSARIHFPR